MSVLPVSLMAGADSLSIKYDSSEIKPLRFDADHLIKYRTDKAFDYTEFEYKNTFWTKIKRWAYNILLTIFKWLFGQKKATVHLNNFMRIIPYLLLAVLIFLIVRFLFKKYFVKYFGNSIAEARFTYGEDEEIIRKKDINTLLKEAVEKENYRMAMRYYYLKLLKKLEENNIIKWEPQKTNFEYLLEIKQKEYVDKFRRFTLWYDYIWYGKYPLGSSEFSVISREFESFLKSLIK